MERRQPGEIRCARRARTVRHTFGNAAILVGFLTFFLLNGSAGLARDDGADGKFNRRSSSHFTLLQDVDIDRYSGPKGSREFEVRVLEILEEAYDLVGEELWLRPRSRIAVYIYDPQIFDAEFSKLFGFRAAGFFNGTIHVRGGTRVDARLIETLNHEYVHAALDWRARGAYPAWLNEGVAQYFGARALDKRRLSSAEFGYLQRIVREDAWISLESLSSRSLVHLVGDDVAIAYLESYALVEQLIRKHGMRDLRNLIENLGKTRSTARALRRSYKATLPELEAELIATLR